MAQHAARSVSQQAQRAALRCLLTLSALQHGLAQALDQTLATALRFRGSRQALCEAQQLPGFEHANCDCLSTCIFLSLTAYGCGSACRSPLAPAARAGTGVLVAPGVLQLPSDLR